MFKKLLNKRISFAIALAGTLLASCAKDELLTPAAQESQTGVKETTSNLLVDNSYGGVVCDNVYPWSPKAIMKNFIDKWTERRWINETSNLASEMPRLYYYDESGVTQFKKAYKDLNGTPFSTGLRAGGENCLIKRNKMPSEEDNLPGITPEQFQTKTAAVIQQIEQLQEELHRLSASIMVLENEDATLTTIKRLKAYLYILRLYQVQARNKKGTKLIEAYNNENSAYRTTDLYRQANAVWKEFSRQVDLISKGLVALILKSEIVENVEPMFENSFQNLTPQQIRDYFDIVFKEYRKEITIEIKDDERPTSPAVFIYNYIIDSGIDKNFLPTQFMSEEFWELVCNHYEGLLLTEGDPGLFLPRN
jgi:hypothetical protein